MSTSSDGFSGSFQARMAWLFHESARHLLVSDGWRNFDKGVDITHDELEKTIDMDELARAFEQWLDDQLNKVTSKDPDDDSDCDCIGPSHVRTCKHWVLPN